mmetsp:Transcript_9001/g.13846  ORF Transcript_9001/g.13846 Transcript_9001/m.13846 type:complete len:115 (+) Transcript_9001:687-1031(+)
MMRSVVVVVVVVRGLREVGSCLLAIVPKELLEILAKPFESRIQKAANDNAAVEICKVVIMLFFEKIVVKTKIRGDLYLLKSIVDSGCLELLAVYWNIFYTKTLLERMCLFQLGR